MIDFIKIVLYSPREIYLGNLLKGKYGYLYPLPHKAVNIIVDEDNKKVELGLSAMYCMQGHNFTFDRRLFMECIKILCEALHINLWVASVEVLEFGVIIEVEDLPSEFIKRHHGKPEQKLCEDEKKADKTECRFWRDKKSRHYIKMYNAGKNLNQKTSKHIRNSIRNHKPTSNYVKFEVHYNCPHRSLNEGKNILLYQLLTPSWIDRLKEDLLLQYQRLYVEKKPNPPKNKKEAHATKLLYRMLLEYGSQLGKGQREIKEDYYAIMRSCHFLTTNDRKSRQAFFKKTEKSISYEEGKNCYDLMEHIVSTLNKE